ncbi:MAG: DUF2914 domain-containing protein [Methylococcaceae bacterium]
MMDKKNILIKVKYPVSGNRAGISPPKLITVWNVKRLVFAASALFLVLVSLFYVINDNIQKTDLDNAGGIENITEKQPSPQLESHGADIKTLSPPGKLATEISAPEKSKKEPNKKNNQNANITVQDNIKGTIKNSIERKHSPYLRRSLLTYGIENKEPVGKIASSVKVSGKKPTWIYYFTEFRAMKGMSFYHEWFKNGVLVFRPLVVISDDRWRASSRKLLSDSDKGKWIVKLVDEKGQLLDEKSFKAE